MRPPQQQSASAPSTRTHTHRRSSSIGASILLLLLSLSMRSVHATTAAIATTWGRHPQRGAAAAAPAFMGGFSSHSHSRYNNRPRPWAVAHGSGIRMMASTLPPPAAADAAAQQVQEELAKASTATAMPADPFKSEVRCGGIVCTYMLNPSHPLKIHNTPPQLYRSRITTTAR